MEELNYSKLAKEIEKQLRKADSIVLATCADGKVTARTMCHINEGAAVLFSTNRNSQKVQQMRLNPNVALTVGNLRIEAVAELFGHPSGHPTFGEVYAKKFPHLGGLYAPNPDDLLVICRPSKASLYQYIGGPQEEILLPEAEKAWRRDLSQG